MSRNNQEHFSRLVGTVFLGVVFFAAAPTLAQRGPSFQGLGLVPAPGFDAFTSSDGLSADGLVAIGHGLLLVGDQEPFRWTEATGFMILPGVPGAIYSSPHATSGDGSVVVGTSRMGTGLVRAFRWTLSRGTVFIGDLPGGDVNSAALGVSADASVIVGGSETGSGTEAFRWTQSGGMVGLGFLPGLTFASSATDVSGDGTVIVGSSSANFGADPASEAFRWTASEGMVGLGDLLGGSFQSRATAVSSDGSVVVGSAVSGGGSLEAFRWTAAGGMVGLGDLPGGFFSSVALDVSADGSVVVGLGNAADQEAFIWDPVNGMRKLQDVLENELGLDLQGWFNLGSADGISADGRVITGTGRNPDSRLESWIAVLNECGRDADCSDGLFCNGVETCVANVCVPGVDVCPAGDPCIEASHLCASDIPTLSQWGLVALTLLLLTAATSILNQRTSRAMP